MDPDIVARSAPISVCHVAVGDLWGGAEVQLRVLLGRLARRGDLKLSVVLFNGGRLEQELSELGIPVEVYPEQQWGSARIFSKLMRGFRKDTPQIVHTHKYKDTILASLAAKLCGIPRVVRTVHGLREPFTGMQAFKMNVYETIERTVHRHCVDAIIGVSSQIESTYKTEGAVSRVTCIRNGIDLEKKPIQTDRWQTRKELGVDAEACLIGTVGRLTPVKGLSYLLQAVSILLRQRVDLRLLIVGDGVIRKDLEAQAHDLGISENVVFLGHREDTLELMQAMDIFVLPSLSEGIPMALLEAMAVSRPVVASRVGGIPEIITDGIDGYLVEAMDAEGLVNRCRRLIDSPDLARNMGDQARSRVERDFSAAGMTDQVVALYRGLIGTW